MDDEKRKKLLERRAERERQAEAEKHEREDLVLELEDRFSTPGMVRGRDFEIVETPEGVVAVKRVHGMAWSAWEKYQHDLKGPILLDAMINHALGGLLFPLPEEFKLWCKGTDTRPGCEGVATAACAALNRLHGQNIAAQAGK